MKLSSCVVLLVFISACDHKSSPFCEKHELTYIEVLPEQQIADQAAFDMTSRCQGSYNIESITDDGKHKTYIFSCSAKCG